MFSCPHCHKPIEIGITPDGKIPWYHLDPGNPKVSLGCGTLLLIGIIVYLCSGGFHDGDEIRELQNEVRALAKKIDAMSEAVRPAEAEPASQR